MGGGLDSHKRKTSAPTNYHAHSRPLFPRRVKWFADQIRRIRSWPRSELLRSPIVHFGSVEIPVLVDAESVHSPEAARKISPGAPRILEVPLEIVLQHLGS